MLAKNVVWNFYKTSLLEVKISDYFQPVWQLLMLFGMF